MASAFPPVPLESGELVLLSGGRSWHAWLFTFAVLPAACMMLPLFVLPWVLSGRYWLTQRRLIFQTPLGKPQVMALRDLTQVEVVVGVAVRGLSTRSARSRRVPAGRDAALEGGPAAG